MVAHLHYRPTHYVIGGWNTNYVLYILIKSLAPVSGLTRLLASQTVSL